MAHFGSSLAVCLCLLPTVASAQTTEGTGVADANNAVSAKPAVVMNPPWLRRATGYDVQRVFPRAALRARQYAGDVIIECKVAKDGALTSCTLIDETPQGFGFGEAGLKLAQKFKMKTERPDGRPTEGGKVRIPLMLRAPR